ncbi:MAG: nuclear transport factor 2 family protein [Steroidobacteraceae bacterium]|nr:nuclear transport factor 2 family protein [Steroidobacteraceae bacterium]
MNARTLALPAAVLALAAPLLLMGEEDPAKVIAAIDTEYQLAVERNDWHTMDRILHPGFTLVLGNGAMHTRTQLVDSAKNADRTYEKQVEMPGTQAVRMYGNETAVVTALLWLKGARKSDGSTFDYKLWFSDTYVMTKDGWKYAFGQASLRLPQD